MQLVARPVYHNAHRYANAKYSIMQKSPAPGITRDRGFENEPDSDYLMRPSSLPA